jgi:hypothetical protein
MNINRFNINHIIIKNDKFDIDNVKCNINNKTIQLSFIIIEYETQYFSVDGIYLETPILSLFSSCVLVNNCKHKYLFEIPLLDNDKFNTIFSNIDRKINKIVSKTNTVYEYEKYIKENIITIDNDDYEYKYITASLNCNECTITLDNKTYNGDLKELDYSKIQMKFILSCYGLCKTDNHFSLSWKILKLDMKTIVLDLNNYKNILFKKISKKIKNKETPNKETPNKETPNKETPKKDYYLNNTININIDNIHNIDNVDGVDEEEHIYIPNFELELENIDN